MLTVDSALLDLTEWLCRRFQVLTGRTNVWLAFQLTNFSIIVFFVWAGMHLRIGGQPFRIALVAFCGGLLYLLTRTLFRVPVETYENNEYRRVSRGFRNPRRVRDALLRIAFLTFSLMLFFPVLFVYQYPQVLAILNLPVSSFIVAHGLTDARAQNGLPPFDHPRLRSAALPPLPTVGVALAGASEPTLIDVLPTFGGNHNWKLGMSAGDGHFCVLISLGCTWPIRRPFFGTGLLHASPL